jgi:hypothetical protein
MPSPITCPSVLYIFLRGRFLGNGLLGVAFFRFLRLLLLTFLSQASIRLCCQGFYHLAIIDLYALREFVLHVFKAGENPLIVRVFL